MRNKDEKDIRELAFMMDEDGVTTEELQAALAGLEDRIHAGEDNETMRENYYTLKDVERELDYWEGTAREHEAEQRAAVAAPAPVPITKLYMYDGRRRGVAREGIASILTQTGLAATVADLREQGYEHVINIPDSGVTNGVSQIWYLPSERYVPKADHVDEISKVIRIMGYDYRKEASVPTDERPY